MNPTINDSPAGARLSAMTADRTSHQNLHRLNYPKPPAPLLGDHSVSDPPDPISNSAVKPDSADGTNAQALEE
jgi:hypothetical protein